MSETTKLRFDPSAGRVTPASDMAQPLDAPQPDIPEQDDTEAAMRRALGLNGDVPRQRVEGEQQQMGARQMDRFGPGIHRRRFVQDGDVPVTLVRRDAAVGPAPTRDNQPGPTSSRLQRVEATLQAETAARTLAERALADAQTMIRDLQTKIGHAELANREAIEKMRRELDATLAQHKNATDQEAKLRDAEERAEMAEEAYHTLQTELSAERSARRTAERALREAIAARDHAETLVRALTTAPEQEPEEEDNAPLTFERPAPVKLGRPRKERYVAAEPVPISEPEPVQWWLTTKPGAKRK